MSRTETGAFRQARAFTLVELLVVIGILAVLISILIPGLGRANAAAQRTVCLSNLRQVHQAFAFYADSYDDQVPLGYRSTGIGPIKQYNSMVYSATSGQYVIFGLLYKKGLMDSPAAFFCPAETNEQSIYKSSINPWPPGPDGDATKNVYCGYACRPEVPLPDKLTSATPKLPKLANFKNKAILSDVTTVPDRVTTRHKTGINVLYGDGSARWVDYGVFSTDLAPCKVPPSVTWNDAQGRVWADLDRQ